jgi:hypothetical protein
MVRAEITYKKAITGTIRNVTLAIFFIPPTITSPTKNARIIPVINPYLV